METFRNSEFLRMGKGCLLYSSELRAHLSFIREDYALHMVSKSLRVGAPSFQIRAILTVITP